MDLCNINEIKALLTRHGFHFSKAKGQNFLTQSWVPREIVLDAGIDDTCGVLEVGPGMGVLTKELARRAKKVVAVEVDKRLPPLLAETLAEYENVTVVEGDVLKVDLAALIRDEFPGLRVAVCANLPYYITSPIVMKLLEERLPIEHITVMVQKEAADRLSALIKCTEEVQAGNREFASALAQQKAAITSMHCPEADYFLEHMLPCYAQNLDELTRAEGD